MSANEIMLDKSKTNITKEDVIRGKPKWSIKNVYLLMCIWMIINFLWTIRNISNYLMLMIGIFLPNIPMFKPFGNPLYPSFIELVLYSISIITMWLIFTKVDESLIKECLDLRIGKKSIGMKKFLWLFKPIQSYKMIKVMQKEKVYLRTFVFVNVLLGIGSYFVWYVTSSVYLHVIPYFLQHIVTVDLNSPLALILVGNPTNLLRLFMFIPFVMVMFVLVLLWVEYGKYKDSFNNAFVEYEFSNQWLQKKIHRTDITDIRGNELHYPDVVLGPNSKTKEMVVQPGNDRTLNNIIVGSIGTGKTAALVLPIINQDLHWMTRFINHFPSVHKRDDYNTEEVQGMYLNGLSIIEPSNDLCQKAYRLVKSHGIPEETVFYIDPTNPETPSINVMRGPVDKVAEAFAMVIEGLAEGGQGNFFFQQSERNHLKHYIYLLKMHKGETEDDNATFDLLLDMYNNAQLVRQMHIQLKDTFPETDIDSIENRDERNHWKIIQQIDEWFDNSLLPRTSRSGEPVKVRTGKYRGEEEYYDAKAEYVQGLRNILNDIGSNKLLRRVLFGHSKFNMDKHLKYGGVLLVNTAKGELGELSNVLGKLVLLNLQNGVFRRPPNISTFHHIIVDEFPDYVYRPFKEFPAQSRKYKAIVTVVAQTITQLADKYGTTYMHTLLGTLRHKMVYGDIPQFDAQLFSQIFGEEERYDEGTQEQEISPLQDDPTLRTGSNYTRTKDVIMTPSDIIFQKEFQAAVKIVKNNRPIPVVQIDANFVNKDEFETAIELVEEESGTFWLNERNRQLDLTSQHYLEDPIEEIEEDISLDRENKKITEVPKDITIKRYPTDYDEEGIDEEVDNIVQFPTVVSNDSEANLFIKELKDTFSGEDSEQLTGNETNLSSTEPENSTTKTEVDDTELQTKQLENLVNKDESEEQFRKQQEIDRLGKERAFHEEQKRLSMNYKNQQHTRHSKNEKEREIMQNQSDFMSDFGIFDADED
ncbi:type IV secretory system conjugative DNA transfer family protein [Oceanobacillus kimchii]|uniref:TraD/TraG TraM recognition site domain-containing protein n=1 Tax=Oceanobacillus kimchii TaxID=746691 RepID=A0ABQ5TPZ7_9BACI|nr:type IV secretory system conjugative DNA transfer family protein [Oceanobacillus kimchii]GLO68282.1 hypothetical protein MACH08_40660 [Oceanobacillus kimchii]